MRMTYRQLRTMMEHFNDDQLDSDITVEVYNNEFGNCNCYPAELRIAGPEHDGGLDLNHPVIHPSLDESDERYNDQTLNGYILNLKNDKAFS